MRRKTKLLTASEITVLSAIYILHARPANSRALARRIMSRNFLAELRHVTHIVNVVHMGSPGAIYIMKMIPTSRVATVIT